MFSQSVRAGLRTASRASVRAMSSAPVRAVPRVSAALVAGAAVSGLVAYNGKPASILARSGKRVSAQAISKAHEGSSVGRSATEKGCSWARRREAEGRKQDTPELEANIAAYQTPALMAGEKTIAGEKGTSSERSFVMVRPRCRPATSDRPAPSFIRVSLRLASVSPAAQYREVKADERRSSLTVSLASLSAR